MATRKKAAAAAAANDRTFIDPETSLEWTETLGDPVIWKDAKAMEKTCRIGGHNDWALALRKQMLTLVDDTRINPATNIDLIPDMKSSWYWTRTEGASSLSDYAWNVYFGYGASGLGNKNGKAFVRLVRRAGASQ